ncbi:hopanoid-associated sugar epimerase [Algihabitans albus]|uniref:hopanoid-associated sugar epimerase n=1 Tax=Algihabitans albus TaxID=2164067 RepID=UPI000E5CD22D|nr:hopanoid-associated sugar epimerase [Algihabitans albus]
MTVLVTGASGFVGAAVARNLLGRGHRVRALLRSGSPRLNLKDLDVETVIGDLREPGSLEAALQGCSGLVHAAADYRLWTRDPSELYATNVEGTKTLLRLAAKAGVERIVYTSSVATLRLTETGQPSDETCEATLADMTGDYKRSKFLAEQAVRDLVRDEGLPAVIVSPSAPIGPGDVRPTPTGRIILEAAMGKMPAYVDTGLNVVHVDDVAEGHRLAFENGNVGEVYILGGENKTLKSILDIVDKNRGKHQRRLRLSHRLVLPLARGAEAWARRFGGQPFATVDGVKMAEHLMFYSSAKAETALGYSHRSADEAISDALAWFRTHGYLH